MCWTLGTKNIGKLIRSVDLKMDSWWEQKIMDNCQCFTLCQLKCDAPAEKAVVVPGGWFCAWNSFCAIINGALVLAHELWEKRATVAMKGLQTSFLESGVWNLSSQFRRRWGSGQKWSLCACGGDKLPCVKRLSCWGDLTKYSWIISANTCVWGHFCVLPELCSQHWSSSWGAGTD